MLRVKKSQMLFVEGRNGDELMRSYNESMNGLVRSLATVTDNIISIENLSAVILYEVTEEIPETIKDRYALAGIFPKCADCPCFVPTKYGGTCHRVQGTLRKDDDICKARWAEIEQERRDYVTESDGRDGQARREQSATR